jgi:hypothetical protein
MIDPKLTRNTGYKDEGKTKGVEASKKIGLCALCPSCGEPVTDWVCLGSTYRVYCQECGTSKERYQLPRGSLRLAPDNEEII